ncbi:MAG: aspartate 1-decarboxylase [Candidatus Pacebacteria bacterium]|nr:aspartate 1-decarboxylase [Candidatus Paceibacterota bacterium]
MLLEVCVGKIHRATVTQADLNYVGSITIDEKLAAAAGMKQFQKVTITNLRNGVLWYTYVMFGAPDSGTICLNGPPAHHFEKGDLVIILAYAQVTPEELESISPTLVFVDGNNKITEIKKHPAVSN